MDNNKCQKLSLGHEPKRHKRFKGNFRERQMSNQMGLNLIHASDCPISTYTGATPCAMCQWEMSVTPCVHYLSNSPQKQQLLSSNKFTTWLPQQIVSSPSSSITSTLQWSMYENPPQTPAVSHSCQVSYKRNLKETSQHCITHTNDKPSLQLINKK